MLIFNSVDRGIANEAGYKSEESIALKLNAREGTREEIMSIVDMTWVGG